MLSSFLKHSSLVNELNKHKHKKLLLPDQLPKRLEFKMFLYQ